MVVDKKDGTVAEGDIATIDYEELDEEGKPKPGSKREGFVFTVGTGYNLYKLDDDIIGMKKDEEKEISKEFPEDYEIAELKGKSVKLNVKVTAVKEKQMPELDDELAQDISEKYKTLEDLKKDIKAKLKEASQHKIKEKNIAALMDKIIENSPIDLPQSMIDIELEGSWQNFVQQFRAQEQEVIQLLAEQGKTKEQLLEEWTPTTEKKIKNRLLMTKIIEEEKIEITDNDIEEEILRQSEAGNVPLEDLKKRVESERMKEYLKSDLADRKLFDLLLEATTITKGKKVKFLDLMQDKQ
jgi:trigger factor